MNTRTVLLGTDRWNLRLDKKTQVVHIAGRNADKTLAIAIDSAAELGRLLTTLVELAGDDAPV